MIIDDKNAHYSNSIPHTPRACLVSNGAIGYESFLEFARAWLQLPAELVRLALNI